MRRTRARAATAVLVAGLVGLQLPAVHPVSAAEPSLLTTSSTRTVAWTDQGPRHPGDRSVAAALEDWRVRVSQTSDLLNQTIQVTWSGGESSGNATFLAVMQCWSDAPQASPKREQCAFGGVDPESLDGSGSARTRALSEDPREAHYRYDGDLLLASVAGAAPGRAWSAEQEVVLGTTSARCPKVTTAWSAWLVPSRASGLGRVRLGGGPGTPEGVSVQAGTRTRDYPTATNAFTLAAAATALGRSALPQGAYRVELACSVDATVAAVFAAWVSDRAVPGEWRMAFHEGGAFVPFDPVGGGPDLAPTDPYERNEVLEHLKPRTSNEIWQARNDPSGGGEVFFEVQTDLEAPHLGCGRVEPSGPRPCWLVLVPRWAGDPVSAEPGQNELASPLTQTLWDRRIEVPLSFAPVAAGCRIGSGLKQVLADDLALTALRSWQPTFCDRPSTSASVLGPLQDFAVRAGLSAPNRMGVVGVPSEGVPTEVRVPLATAGVAVAFSLEKVIPLGSARYVENGTRETLLNLTPRLLAKLLTQSYDSGAAPNGGKDGGYNGAVYSGGFSPTFSPARRFPSGNPRTLLQDPEFLRTNPQIAAWVGLGGAFNPQDLADVLVAASDADAYQVLWRWIAADRDAAAFLAGAPDPDGMRVNPYYEGQVGGTTSSFPQLDPTCADLIADPTADSFPLLCQGNVHPRVEDDGEAAQAAVRGDNRRVDVAPLVFDAASSYRAQPRQEAGRRALLVVTNTAVASRYGLPMAALRNASGDFVAPTTASLSAARAQMRVRDDGVLLPRPEKVTGAGYPLTSMLYAVIDVAATTQAQNDAFAAMLTYAVDEGQTPGTAVGLLPPGYAPLTPRLAAQALAGIAVLEDPADLLPQAPGPSPPAGPSGPSGPGGQAPAETPAPGVPTSSLAPGATPARPAGQAPRPVVATVTAAATSAARAQARWALPVLLVGAVALALAGRTLSSGAPRAGRTTRTTT